MRLAESAERARQVPARDLGFQPHLVGALQFAAASRMRIRAFGRAEVAGALAGEGARLVVTDLPGSGLGERGAHGVEVIAWHERHQLPHGVGKAVHEVHARQAQPLGQCEGDAAVGRVEVGVRGVERDAGFGESKRQRALAGVGGESGERAKKQRMMRDNERGLAAFGLVDDGVR